jgi:single-stranded-DNA-specific exonuclease
MKAHWQIHQPDPDVVEKLSRDLGYHPITAAALVNRRISAVSDARDFINTSLNNLRPPFSLRDMEAAVDRIFWRL